MKIKGFGKLCVVAGAVTFVGGETAALKHLEAPGKHVDIEKYSLPDYGKFRTVALVTTIATTSGGPKFQSV